MSRNLRRVARAWRVELTWAGTLLLALLAVSAVAPPVRAHDDCDVGDSAEHWYDDKSNICIHHAVDCMWCTV